MNVALVTGASRGIGRAVALQLAKDHGLHILINYSSNHKAAEETKKCIEQEGGSAELLQFNVQNADEVEKISKWQKEHPDDFIEVLVNNAGVTRDNLLALMKEEDWDTVLNISAKGMFLVSKAVVGSMLRKRSGRIINMVSLSGLKGVPGQFNYSAAKGAMIAATKSLAQEVAKRKVTVNAVAPGFIHSDMTADLPEDDLKKMVPLNRFGQPEEVAHLVSFLASPKSSYITGEVINVNGGIYS